MQTAISKGMKHTAKEYLDAVDFMKRSYESYKEVFEDYHWCNKSLQYWGSG